MEYITLRAKEAFALIFLTLVMGLAVWGACDIASNIRQQKPDFNYTVTTR